MTNEDLKNQLLSTPVPYPGIDEGAERRYTIAIVEKLLARIDSLIEKFGPILRWIRPGLFRELEGLRDIIEEYLRRLKTTV